MQFRTTFFVGSAQARDSKPTWWDGIRAGRRRVALAGRVWLSTLPSYPEPKTSVPGEPTAGARDDEADHQRFLDAIGEGIADAAAGRVHTHAEVVARIRGRFAAVRACMGPSVSVSYLWLLGCVCVECWAS